MIWNFIARQLARPSVVVWLINRAKRTPYTHITSPSGTVYMERYWLFNPYPPESSGKRPWWKFPISVRLHRILRQDDDRHLHDHPWNARTVILQGWYAERRPYANEPMPPDATMISYDAGFELTRHVGYTGQLRFCQYHRITAVAPGGVWTLFITGRYRGTWGFHVDGVKVPWREYLGVNEAVAAVPKNEEETV